MRQLTILLVDDHEGFLDSAERFLKTLDWITVVGRAVNGLEAVKRAEELKPDACPCRKWAVCRQPA